MAPRKLFVPFFIFLLFFPAFSIQAARAFNEPAKTIAVRTSEPPHLDGSLSDPAWEKANIASGFNQYDPHNDRPASHETFVRVLYDDDALYIGAFMYDPSPDSILTELGLRDSGDNLNADRFWVDINPFNDGINGFRFQVSASGVQTDLNMSGAGNGGGFRRGDSNWDAVWESSVGRTEDGWIVEMAIPYAALRFPHGEAHEWGINFWREIRRKRESSSWNFVNRRIGDVIASMGVINGIYGIDPPLRLAFFPYLSNYVENNGMNEGWTNTFNGGMDLKLGISPAFTMDVTLIPDFGQVQSDAQVLNLSPYEVKFDENRQFFTEGTELFGKADLLYSRRIGATPTGRSIPFHERREHEVIAENPPETRMINATKLSGRTGGGLGIGVFNAMTAESHATLRDTLTGDERLLTTQPFTNYNLLVLDQSLRNNSFISLVNTNVLGSREGYTANVTGTELRLLDRSNMYRISGTAALSQQYYDQQKDVFGFKYDLSIGKVGGTWQYGYARSAISDTYDQNDMGFLRRNNEIEDDLSFSHNIFVPFWRVLNMSNAISLEYSRLYDPNTFTGMELAYRNRTLFDTRYMLFFNLNYLPVGRRDYFEPRAPGRFYETDPGYRVSLRYSSDYRKRIYFNGNFGFGRLFSEYNQSGYEIDFRPSFRASDRFNLSWGSSFKENMNEIGYVLQLNPDSVFFGKRNTPTLTNTLQSTYIFTTKLSLDLAFRHYWSRAVYDGEFFFLKSDGRLQPWTGDMQIADINYNAFTIDLKLTWNFAPGSQLTAVWKNVIDNRGSDLPDGFLDNLTRTLREPQINSFSVKFLYYLDYQTIRRISRRG
ncbi:MAG: DUF5916 domain-containing protein [Bacteroidales bacterium]